MHVHLTRTAAYPLLAIALSTLLSGCTLCQTAYRTIVKEPAQFDWEHDREASKHYYWKLATRVWSEHRDECPDLVPPQAYVEGFKFGFADYVYAGGNGEPPPIPPRKSWNLRFRNAQGQREHQQWFAGYRHGARIARYGGYRRQATLSPSVVLARHEDSYTDQNSMATGSLPRDSFPREQIETPPPVEELQLTDPTAPPEPPASVPAPPLMTPADDTDPTTVDDDLGRVLEQLESAPSDLERRILAEMEAESERDRAIERLEEEYQPAPDNTNRVFEEFDSAPSDTDRILEEFERVPSDTDRLLQEFEADPESAPSLDQEMLQAPEVEPQDLPAAPPQRDGEQDPFEDDPLDLFDEPLQSPPSIPVDPRGDELTRTEHTQVGGRIRSINLSRTTPSRNHEPRQRNRTRGDGDTELWSDLLETHRAPVTTDRPPKLTPPRTDRAEPRRQRTSPNKLSNRKNYGQSRFSRRKRDSGVELISTFAR